MKKNQATTIGELVTGDIFCLTRGGVQFEKLPGKSDEGGCLAKICGDRDSQPLTKNFPVYFIKHKPTSNDKRTVKGRVSGNIQLSFPIQPGGQNLPGGIGA